MQFCNLQNHWRRCPVIQMLFGKYENLRHRIPYITVHTVCHLTPLLHFLTYLICSVPLTVDTVMSYWLTVDITGPTNKQAACAAKWNHQENVCRSLRWHHRLLTDSQRFSNLKRAALFMQYIKNHSSSNHTLQSLNDCDKFSPDMREYKKTLETAFTDAAKPRCSCKTSHKLIRGRKRSTSSRREKGIRAWLDRFKL